MDDKIKDAQYAVSNLSTLRENVYAYASYARGLCGEIEYEDATLYEKVENARDGIGQLVEYINGVINKAK